MLSLTVTCSLALSVGVVLGADNWLVDHFRNLSVAQARRKLATRDIKGAITTFDLATSHQALIELIGDSHATRPSREDIIRQVTPLQACNDARFAEVVRIYTNSQDHLSHQFALELHKQVIAISQLEHSIAALESRIRSYIALWRAPTEELSALLGLRPVEASDSLEIPHYTSGVLASLPKLERLADNIATLVDLRAAIQSAKGNVSITGSDAAQQFAERLRLLRLDCAAITEPFDQLINELGEQKKQLNIATQEAELWCKKGAERAIDELSDRIL